MSKPDFSALLGEMLGGGSGQAPNRPKSFDAHHDLETTLGMLAAKAKELAAECPFKVGDLVTPKDDGSVKGAGVPYLVTEVLPLKDAPRDLTDAGAPRFNAPLAMCVVTVVQPNEVLQYWNSHLDFRAFTEEDKVAYNMLFVRRDDKRKLA